MPTMDQLDREGECRECGATHYRYPRKRCFTCDEELALDQADLVIAWRRDHGR